MPLFIFNSDYPKVSKIKVMGGSIVRRLVLLMMMMFIVHVPVVMQVDPTAPSLLPSSVLPNLITLPRQNYINYIACTVE